MIGRQRAPTQNLQLYQSILRYLSYDMPAEDIWIKMRLNVENMTELVPEIYSDVKGKEFYLMPRFKFRRGISCTSLAD